MNNFLAFLTKHKPSLLIGLGIGSMIAATISGITHAPMAYEAVENKKKELNVEKLNVVDSVKTTCVFFAPAAIFSIVGVACILSGNNANVERGAAAMAAYALSESALHEYRHKVREVVGEKKEKDIQEAVAKDVIERNPSTNKEIIITGKGETLCLDKISGRYFKSDIEKLKHIENELNRKMMDMTFISLNELYLEIGLSPVTLGDELGWDIGRGLIDMSFSAQLTDSGEPCLVLDFNVAPKQF